MIPPGGNPGFVAAMEDVLETYQRPRDPDRPLVCLDETSKQLIAEMRVPIPPKPGRPARHDYEYQRNGVANLFMIFAPLEGWRRVEVTDHHAAVDYAKVLMSYPTSASSPPAAFPESSRWPLGSLRASAEVRPQWLSFAVNHRDTPVPWPLFRVQLSKADAESSLCSKLKDGNRAVWPFPC